ncbi:VOC family protein [Megalodesulfovibrio gigas]|uniref:Putative lactoylglutathione lyase n=1 Tax=Megalodesulfovibrio gigas (strain ATCC 19364 / DSM 1382 / NCIMB 9332 / VKM B-1759) TaxID=1121448 RepID=T2GDB8_MEGG1|nr:VOC family protein [Megalodesulfovibrio gigas]AGW13917.1 putative lactoylglutathione lyase [Megalodesulfovibrio gigas DSM 1382 = ATCC 19364]
MQPRISMITLGVADLDRATRFYEEGLGLPRMPFEGRISFFSLQGTWLALYDRATLAEDALLPPGMVRPLEEGGFSGVTLSHNVSSKAEADAVLARAVAAGARLLKPAQDVFWGGYSGYFADPDGHLWEVAWNPHCWIGPPAMPPDAA